MFNRGFWAKAALRLWGGDCATFDTMAQTPRGMAKPLVHYANPFWPARFNGKPSTVLHIIGLEREEGPAFPTTWQSFRNKVTIPALRITETRSPTT